MADPADIPDQLRRSASDPAIQAQSPAEIAALFRKAAGHATVSAPAVSTDRPQAWQDRLIEQHIPDGASVLDLGCGNGELLERLIHRKHVRGQGVEVDVEAVFHCTDRNVPVFQADLDQGLKGFDDQSFDYVVLEETLQTLRYPAEVLKDMLRVGRHGIVSFPNFAHWRVRADLALRGRMPVTAALPYRWHDTPNIHLLSLQDFIDWTQSAGVRIVQGHVLYDGQVRPMEQADNLLAEEVMLVIDRI